MLRFLRRCWRSDDHLVPIDHALADGAFQECGPDAGIDTNCRFGRCEVRTGKSIFVEAPWCPTVSTYVRAPVLGCNDAPIAGIS
jgi:hypothetical protein